jgi:hypothetical protein
MSKMTMITAIILILSALIIGAGWLRNRRKWELYTLSEHPMFRDEWDRRLNND